MGTGRANYSRADPTQAFLLNIRGLDQSQSIDSRLADVLDIEVVSILSLDMQTVQSHGVLQLFGVRR